MIKKNIKNNEKNKINVYLLIFRIISLIIILVCIYCLYNWDRENKRNSELLDDIHLLAVIPDIEPNNDDDKDTSENKPLVDFSGLLSTNSDTVAWIKVNNTNIDFPVVKSNDNEFYLKHNFNKEYNSAGWIFADFRNRFDNTDKNIIIYGHNRRNGSMFSSLKNVTEESWYTNQNNLIIPFYTVKGSYNYQVFSIYTILAQDFDNSVSFPTEQDFQNYIDKVSSKSIHDFGVEVTPNDSLLTIYTCGNNTKYRIIVHAKKII